MGYSEITRKTGETEIHLTLSLYGSGKSQISTGCGFLDHMLTLFAKHGRFDLTIVCKGDTYVDDHHSVEDIGICLGMAFAEALGNGAGITRYGHMILPMDEALILAAADISGRGYLKFGLQIPTEKVGTFDTELIEEFFMAFTRKSNMTLHIQQMAGRNSHHIIEGAFKAVARSLNMALTIQEAYRDEIPSTKGVL